MIQKRFLACMAVVCILCCGLPASGFANETVFPEYTVVKSNVSFWINIYSRYTTTQAVVHDSVDLDIVYDVIELVPADTPGARKINRGRMKAAAKKYTRILRLLAADPSTPEVDCRRVAALFDSGTPAHGLKQASHQVRCQLGQQGPFPGRTGPFRGMYID